MRAEDLIQRHPQVFHTADARAWVSIQRHGLLTTADLIARYGTPLKAGPRRASSTLQSPHVSDEVVVVRDQAPLKFLNRVLEPGTTEQEFLDLLDGRVFLWATRERLTRLQQGRLYRNTPQVVLTVDTRSLVDAYGDVIELSPYNSGSAHVPTAPKRGRSTFKRIGDYDYDGWAKRRGRSGDPLVEVTVPFGVPDIMVHVVDVAWFLPSVVEGARENDPATGDDANEEEREARAYSQVLGAPLTPEEIRNAREASAGEPVRRVRRFDG